MEIYFYCSYEHSQSGFFMTRMEDGELVPAEREGESLPGPVRDFFSYDRFLFLWRDLCHRVDRPWQQPCCTGGFCGLRELEGRMADGRRGTVNMAFLAGQEEETLLRRAVLTMLGDYDGFAEKIFSWLSVGGPCGYRLNGGAFDSWLAGCGEKGRLRRLVPPEDQAARLLPFLQSTRPPRLERETLRLAACTCGWKEISGAMGSQAMWYLRPRCALTREEFTAAFTGRGPVWELESVR